MAIGIGREINGDQTVGPERTDRYDLRNKTAEGLCVVLEVRMVRQKMNKSDEKHVDLI